MKPIQPGTHRAAVALDLLAYMGDPSKCQYCGSGDIERGDWPQGMRVTRRADSCFQVR